MSTLPAEHDPLAVDQSHSGVISALTECTTNRPNTHEADTGTPRNVLISPDEGERLDKNMTTYIKDYFGSGSRAVLETDSAKVPSHSAEPFCEVGIQRDQSPAGTASTDRKGCAALVASQFGMQMREKEQNCTRMERALFSDFISGVVGILNEVLDLNMEVSEEIEISAQLPPDQHKDDLALTVEHEDSNCTFLLSIVAKATEKGGPKGNDLDRTVLSAKCMIPVSTRSLAFLRELKPGDRLECSGDAILAIRGRKVAQGALKEQAGKHMLQISNDDQSTTRVA